MIADLRSRMTRVARTAVLLGAACTLLPAAEVQAQRWTLPADMQSRVDGVFSFIGRDAPGCALGVIQDGQLAYGRGYGLANLEWQAPITTSTVFDIGSVSKQYTAAAVALLEVDGVLSLDDEVRKWVPGFPEYGAPVTVRQLLNHTSGVRDYLTLLDLQGFEYDNLFDELDGVELINRQNGLNFSPGSEYLYSNSGYLLLANIVRNASGRSVRRFLEDRFFDPLGMAHTMIWDDNTEIVPERAVGYSHRGGGWTIDHSWNFEMGGDGQVITSIEDMVKWDGLFYDPVVGGPELMQRMHERGVLTSGDTINYALGLTVSEYRGLRSVSHGGSWAGFRAHLLRIPDQRTSVAVLCNRSDGGASVRANRVMDVVLEGAFVEAPSDEAATAPQGPVASEVTLTRNQLERWVGVYRTPERPNYWRFEVRDERLHIVLPDDSSLPLAPTSETSFRIESEGIRVSFQPRTDEWPEGVRVGSTVFLRQYPEASSREHTADLVGRYYSDELDTTYEVVEEDGALFLLQSGTRRNPFRPGAPGEYEAGGVAYVLETDGQGRVSGFRVFAGRVTDILFTKVGS